MASAGLVAELKSRVRGAVRRVAVLAALGLLAAGCAGVAVLYFIYGFFLWLATELPSWAASLVTGGFMLLLAIIVLLVLVLVSKRKPARRPPLAATAMSSAMGSAAGSAAAARLAGSVLRRMSPRLMAVGLGAVAALMFVVSGRGRDSRDKSGGKSKRR